MLLDDSRCHRARHSARLGRAGVPGSRSEYRRVVSGVPECTFQGTTAEDVLVVHPFLRGASRGFRLTDCAGSVALLGNRRPADRRTTGSDYLVQRCVRRRRRAAEKHVRHGCGHRDACDAADVSASILRGALRDAGWAAHGVVAPAVGDSIGAGARMARHDSPGYCPRIHDSHEIHWMAGVVAGCDVRGRPAVERGRTPFPQKRTRDAPAADHHGRRASHLLHRQSVDVVRTARWIQGPLSPEPQSRQHAQYRDAVPGAHVQRSRILCRGTTRSCGSSSPRHCRHWCSAPWASGIASPGPPRSH